MKATLIEGGTLVTMGPGREIVSPGAVLVEGSCIEAIGPTPELRARFPEAIRFNAHDKLILPGLINAHVHAGHILLRGGPSQDRSHLDWLVNVLYPAVDAYDEQAVRIAYLLFCLEAVGSGTTTVVDNVIWGNRGNLTQEVLNLYQQVGLRAVYARMFTDISLAESVPIVSSLQRKEPSVRKVLFPREDTEKALLAIEDLMSKYNKVNGEGLVQVWPAPGIPLFVSPEGLVGSLELARKYDAMLTTHLAETKATSSFQGISVIQYLETLGVLDTRLVAAHCVWLEDRDLRLMKKYGAKVINNVVSNMFLGSGIAPVSTMINLGITVGLGTDDANCNDSANILADMKFAALAQKARQLDAAALSAEKVLEMATIDGARAIGLEAAIGSLEAGKRADLIVLEVEAPHLKPCHHIPSTLVYQARGAEVESVMVNGKWLLQDRRPLFLKGLQEEKRILADAQRISETILQRAGMQHMKNRGWAVE